MAEDQSSQSHGNSSVQNEPRPIAMPPLQMPSTTPPAGRSFLPNPPTLRPALGLPTPRTNSGPKAPRLGLAIPPSPRNPTTTSSHLPSLPTLSNPRRPAAPPLQISTPRGGSYSSQGEIGGVNGRSASGSHDASPAPANYQSNGRTSDPQSANSQQSPRSYVLGQFSREAGRQGTPDISQNSTSSVNDQTPRVNGDAFDPPDISQLSLEQGRTADVEDLDTNGWVVASREKRIQILGGLGEGAGGAVNKCVLTGGKTIFALKVITTDPAPEQKRQIVRELDFNKTCHSPYICKYYGAFVDHTSGTILIAMEYCQGGSLESVYREVKKLGGRTGENVLGRVAEGVLNGLTYLHSKKIIHRDIKPSNILLCRDGQVRLCDFGVSGEFGTKGDANTFIGTSAYMAPERIMGQSYTITSDVWSTGVSLLEVAQNRFPFPADATEDQPKAGIIDLITYIVRQDVPKLKDEPEQGIRWGENFKYFIECCLVKEPNKRASPWKMVEHPWILEVKSKKVNMEKFLRQVWDWKD